MSIVLKDGTVLPDIPSDVLASYPKVVIVSQKDSSGIVTYYAHATSKAVFFHYVFTADNVTFMDILLPIVTDTSGFTWAAGSYMAGTSTSWDMETVDGVIEIQYNLNVELADGTYSELVWSNYDIMTVEEGSDGNPVQTEEVFFANCVKFILPDGTELPALPEGCFETRPYGFVTKIENDGTLLGCVLYTGFDIADYVETELSGQTTRSLVCHATNFVSYEYEVGSDTTWKDGVEDTSGDGLMAMVGANGAFSIDVAWTNFDIFYLDHVDDNGDRVLSDTLYHRSDVNYRIYGGWLNSMGNQARRLGNVSGELKPGEMETVFNGVGVTAIWNNLIISGQSATAPNINVELNYAYIVMAWNIAPAAVESTKYNALVYTLDGVSLETEFPFPSGLEITVDNGLLKITNNVIEFASLYFMAMKAPVPPGTIL